MANIIITSFAVTFVNYGQFSEYLSINCDITWIWTSQTSNGDISCGV